MGDPWGGSWGSAWGVSWTTDTVAPPVVETGGGGDRGVVLFREERRPEPELRLPPPVRITARTIQAPQIAWAAIEVESELTIESWQDGIDFAIGLETESRLLVETSQKQTLELLMAVGQVQGKAVTVKPYFETARAKAETESGYGESMALVEIE